MSAPWGAARGLLLVASLLAVRAAGALDLGAPREVGRLLDRELSEVSGLAASPLARDRLWLVNDGGNAPVLHAVDRAGRKLCRCPVRGVDNRDWEALDAFVLDGTAYLLIADVGDNRGARPVLGLHVVREPETLPVEDLVVAWTQWLRLPTGPVDIESVFVDSGGRGDDGHPGWVYLLTKRDSPPRLWRVPLAPGAGEGTMVAQGPVAVTGIPLPTPADLLDDPRHGRYRGQPTDVAMHPARTGVAVLTYGDAFWFARVPGQSWADALTGAPRRIPLPPLAQQEALTFTRDGDALLVTSERHPAPLLELTVPASLGSAP